MKKLSEIDRELEKVLEKDWRYRLSGVLLKCLPIIVFSGVIGIAWLLGHYAGIIVAAIK